MNIEKPFRTSFMLTSGYILGSVLTGFVVYYVKAFLFVIMQWIGI